MKLRTVSVGLAVLHAAAFLAFLAFYAEANQRDGQAMLLWAYWLVIDFPVSLLVPLSWAILSPESTLNQYWLYAAHGVIGTIWWYCLPALVALVLQALRRKA